MIAPLLIALTVAVTFDDLPATGGERGTAAGILAINRAIVATLRERDIPQILLVHANRLNADHFDRIAAMFMKRGYRFVTLRAAVADNAYESPDTFTGAGGISWIHRWTLTKLGRAGVLPDEPEVPGWVMAAAGVTSE